MDVSPWQFAPAVEARLRSLPEDHPAAPEHHAVLAGAYLRLGLRTLAARTAARCEPETRSRLEAIASELPPDEIPLDRLEAVWRANLGVLADRADARGLLDASPAWREAMRSVAAYGATGGTIVLRTADGWLRFLDDDALVSALPGALPSGPFYLDGFHSPPLLARLFTGATKPAGEAQARLVLLAASAAEALTALSLADLRPMLESPRVELWHGLDALDRVRGELARRRAYALGWGITLPAPPVLPGAGARWPAGAVAAAVNAASRAQGEEIASATARVHAMFQSSDADNRWRTAATGDFRGLRVLVPTTRFTTYLQHAADDVAVALRRLGCEASVLKEPDAFTTPTPLALLDEVERFRPDVVILLNTLRTQTGGALPRGLPVVTWVQDAMPHLFDERAGASFGELDFLVGHLYPELFDRFGFPRERTMDAPVLASAEKFHAEPVSSSLRAAYECEIAYVSHQSETPAAFADRLLAQTPKNSAMARVVPALLQSVQRAVDECTATSGQLMLHLQTITTLALRDATGATPAPKAQAVALHQIAFPLVERALRQQMVGWAADLCARRGWRLNLYGKGWDAHPRFARYAKGPLPHGEALRAAYQCARTHLHAGMGGIRHQRVLECALSGGMTLVRLREDDFRLLEWWAQNELALKAQERDCVAVMVNRSAWLFPLADQWEAMLVHTLFDRVGLPQGERTLAAMQATMREQLEAVSRSRSVPMDAAWLLGDPTTAGFWSRETFDRHATAVVESSELRDSIARWQRASTLRNYDLRGFLARVLAMVGEATSSESVRS